MSRLCPVVAAVAALGALGACGDPPPPVVRGGPAAAMLAPPAPGDLEVARVNGRPVWGSCVTAQARGARSRAVALDECVAFELMAQAAEARGLASDPEVIEATRTALVDRLVETGFEERYRSPADLGEAMAKVIERNRSRMERPAGRASAYARIDVPADAPPAADAQAREVAEQIARELATETGLFPAHLEATAKRISEGKGVKLSFAVVPMQAHGALVKPYADALFTLPDVGRTSKAVRTEWGWDVILLTEVAAPRKLTPEDVARDAFPEVRRSYFQVWVNQIARALGVKVEVDHAQLAALAEDGT